MARVTEFQQRPHTSNSEVNVIGEYSYDRQSFVLASRRSDGATDHKQMLQFGRREAATLRRLLDDFLNQPAA